MFVTGPDSDAGALAATFAAGADDFLALPCAADTLQTRIVKHLRAFEAPVKRAGVRSVNIREIGTVYSTGPSLLPFTRRSDGEADASSDDGSLDGAAWRAGEREGVAMRQNLHGDWAATMQARSLHPCTPWPAV